MTEALEARPPEMVSVSPEGWALLDDLHRGGRFKQEFEAAWQNGAAFLRAVDGLRGRRPLVIEWRGNQRQPGDEPVPADLRVDHVFLVSCKYLSKIVSNSSPSAVFDRLLAGGHGGRATDWYGEIACDAYQALYDACLAYIGSSGLPVSVLDLTASERLELKAALGTGRWPEPLRPIATEFSLAVANASAERWRAALEGDDRERALWRLLRIGGAPYFVLGASRRGALRLRVGTAWDWRQHFEIVDFGVTPAGGEQPVVNWRVHVSRRRSRQDVVVEGHVEVRWSHGKFAQRPEAKVYLDTPHHLVPGYWALT